MGFKQTKAFQWAAHYENARRRSGFGGIFAAFAARHPRLCLLVPDRRYVSILYRARFHRKLNLNDPQRFTEKLQWLKLYDRNPEYTLLVDKYRSKAIVEQKVGAQYVVPTLGVWDTPEEIDLDALPDRFVLKTNHDTKSFAICTDKRTFDLAAAQKRLGEHLHKSIYPNGREWPYKNVKPLIFAEEYIPNDEPGELWDYKFFCFNGEPKIMHILSDKELGFDKMKMTWFDLEFKRLPFTTNQWEAKEFAFKKPERFEEMIELARKLSTGIPFVRIDMFWSSGRIFIGEHTFTPAGGMYVFHPDAWDYTFGRWLTLPKKKGHGQK